MNLHDAEQQRMQGPVRVFVATMEEQMLAVKVLEYSIAKHSKLPVEIIPMHAAGIEVPRPREQKNWPRTPFSFQRFIIPELCAHQGRAIYLDSDMQVFSDISELWQTDFAGDDLLSANHPTEGGRKPQYSVMLLNCEGLKWDIRDIIQKLDSETLSYEQLMYEMVVAPRKRAGISADWNSLEAYVPGRTKLLHYTDMDTQPWIYARHPFGYLWVRDLFEAIDNGFISSEMVFDHIRKGWLRPSLGYQLEHRLEDALLLSAKAREMDEGYVPPYRSIHKHSGTPWVSRAGRMKAKFSHRYYGSSLAVIVRRIRGLMWRP